MSSKLHTKQTNIVRYVQKVSNHQEDLYLSACHKTVRQTKSSLRLQLEQNQKQTAAKLAILTKHLKILKLTIKWTNVFIPNVLLELILIGAHIPLKYHM